MKHAISGSLFVAGCVAGLISLPGARQAQKERPPIIDVHLHALPIATFGPPGMPNPATGKPSAATTDDQVREASLAALKRYNVVRAVTSGTELVRQWKAAAPGRIIASPFFPAFPGGEWPELASLQEAFRAGELGAMGELSLQYMGLTLSSPEMEPYLALAEKLDIPVAVHTGFGPPGISYQQPCCPKFRAALGNPLSAEDALARHPKLRVYLMHAGFPFLEETIALMHAHPQVYADVGVIDWVLPRPEFHAYLKALMHHTECGLPKRLMFGSDQMVWPEAIGMAIENIEAADFLTEDQQRDIFCRNAARFLRLEPAICEPRPKEKR